MKLIIHRDTRKIGGSVIELISSQNSRLIIDIGLPLLEDEGCWFNIEDYSTLSVEELIDAGILPGISGLYKNERYEDLAGSSIDGVLISHAHKDHYGLFKYISKDIKFYLTEPAKKIINLTALFSSLHTGDDDRIINYEYIHSGKTFKVGDFKITPYLMDHSAFDAQGFLIEAEGKRVVYTGDFRDHGRKNTLDYFLNQLPENVDVLIMEGTNLGKDKKLLKTERDIETDVENVLSSSGPVLFTASAQNIDRMVSFYRAAKKAERILLIDVYAANILDALKDHAKIPYPSQNYNEIKVYYPNKLTKRIFEMNKGELANKFAKYKMAKADIIAERNNILMLVRSSIVNDLNTIKKMQNDVFNDTSFIFSQWPGYLEKDGFNKLVDFTKNNELAFHKIHTSGHADPTTLDRVVSSIKPRSLFPIHTMNPEEFHEFNAEVVILENGEEYELL